MVGRTARSIALVAFAVGLTATSSLDASPAASAAPAGAEFGSSDWRQVATGGQHTCGIRTNGRLYCWGIDDRGQLGDGNPKANRTTPTQVAGGATDWVQVSAGFFHTCGRRRSGRLYCWGDNEFGQLGNPAAGAGTTAPIQVAGKATNWSSIAVGGGHTCARRTTGRLFCWGLDDKGQLGDGGTNTNRSVPIRVAGNATNWKQASAGLSHTCARRSTGRLFCWGGDSEGQLGDGGTNTNRSVPVQVAGNATNWTQVSAGALTTCARRSTGRLFCWGDDGFGRLGNGGSDADQPTPVRVSAPAAFGTQISVGSVLGHTCARANTGRLFCWGPNGPQGALGIGSNVESSAVPVEVAGGATDWAQVRAGGTHTCARIASGRLFCWGSDAAGELGDGAPNSDRSVPVQVWE